MNAYALPTTIDVGGTEYRITQGGDFRMVFDCFEALDDPELTQEERIFSCLIIFYEDFNDLEDIFACDDIQELITQMYLFFNCGQKMSEQTEKQRPSTKVRLIDWIQDAQLICSAINKVAGEEIRAKEYLHWWTFMGYYMAIDHSLLSIIATVRDKLVRGTKLEKNERQFWMENPQYFDWNYKTAEQQQNEELVRELWNKE